MKRLMNRSLQIWMCLCAAALAMGFAGCAGKGPIGPPGTAAADQYLFARANEEMKEESWLDARTYFQQIVDNYPNSAVRPDAKLGIGDAHLGEHTPESLVMAANEYKEFLQFYPTHARADYAQFKLAMTHYEKMRAPERDQTDTVEALKEFDVFFEKYPNSALMPEVRARWRETRDRLTEASYRIGIFYFKQGWFPGAIPRFRQILADDPGFSRMDGVYYHLAESILRADKTKKAEALPYFDRVLADYPMSEFVELARVRVEELKIQ
jgi:outer membrane protein assembly factor BamD